MLGLLQNLNFLRDHQAESKKSLSRDVMRAGWCGIGLLTHRALIGQSIMASFLHLGALGFMCTISANPHHIEIYRIRVHAKTTTKNRQHGVSLSGHNTANWLQYHLLRSRPTTIAHAAVRVFGR